MRLGRRVSCLHLGALFNRKGSRALKAMPIWDLHSTHCIVDCENLFRKARLAPTPTQARWRPLCVVPLLVIASACIHYFQSITWMVSCVCLWFFICHSTGRFRGCCKWKRNTRLRFSTCHFQSKSYKYGRTFVWVQCGDDNLSVLQMPSILMMTIMGLVYIYTKR